MSKDILKLVIVGHVDHGRLLFDTNSLPPDRIKDIKKSSKELGKKTEFAFLMDHFQEEREQGITIDTSQTFFKTLKREYVIIDAPGHVEFVKNMITGASQAEAAILIIDLAEGIKEQTKRHAYLLSFLGLKQIIVVFNKMDLVGYKKDIFDKTKQETENLFNRLGVKGSYFIPISASNGDNIAKKSKNISWYSGPTVLESLDLLKKKVDLKNRFLIMTIQGIHKINKKRILMGKVEKGELISGQEIKILPEGKITKIKSIESLNGKIRKVIAGDSAGITIEDPLVIERGNIICEPSEKLVVTDRFKANIFWMSREAVRKNESIIFRCSTQETIAEIEKIEKKLNSSSFEIIKQDLDNLQELEVGEVIIKTKNPVILKNFSEIEELGRFVLVKGGNICAGGIVTKEKI